MITRTDTLNGMADVTLSTPLQPRDLRKESVDEVLSRVEAGLGVVLDRATVTRKRRSVGARSDRGTWVRIEFRPLAKIVAQGQAADGTEAANLLSDIAKPAWYAALSWHAGDAQVVWRADEVEFVTDAPLQRRMMRDVSLSAAWWATFNASLDSLAGQRTTRIATPDTEVITQSLVTREIERAFPGQVDSTLTGPWVPAHADLNWANLTWPGCWIIDWEDWGMAPRGLDSANLWASSLGIPGLAERVRQERRADMETRPGMVMALFCCAKILNDSSIPAELREIVTREASAVVADLQR
ncbi:Phosphotransferase enzyme family protein [Amycolatopsis lurida]|uniref:Aminoglycoside phosphotransferase domain-containing protein n=2 Tax=Amycolatopsis lurida TaxID=31959 RepID=A0A2P2FM45_AMYLU|nr:hypothetical protein BB31_29465 [Amycolatopsis lurida NRRL 2430]SEB38782.1 Phosphotransferase enzyme family protein [Amycolatopsis lurida]